MQASISILFPLVFLTNIWVSETTMPGWLQAIVKVNPVTRVVIAVRELMAGTASATNIGWALLSCAAIIAVLTPITLHPSHKKPRNYKGTHIFGERDVTTMGPGKDAAEAAKFFEHALGLTRLDSS